MEKVEVGKTYRHFKGHVIKIITIGKHTETLEELVVYEHLGSHDIWIRPLAMFLNTEDVSQKAGNTTGQKYRFELIEN